MKLNLPDFDIKITRDDGGGVKVYDRLRGKAVALTPEEYVRQHFVNYLINAKGYRQSLMANEVSLRLNGTARRCDTLVYTRELRPLVVVEYKAPDVAISQKTFDQIARYNSVIRAPWLIVSNGISHYCCRYISTTGEYRFMRDIPAWEELSDNMQKPV